MKRIQYGGIHLHQTQAHRAEQDMVIQRQAVASAFLLASMGKSKNKCVVLIKF